MSSFKRYIGLVQRLRPQWFAVDPCAPVVARGMNWVMFRIPAGFSRDKRAGATDLLRQASIDRRAAKTQVAASARKKCTVMCGIPCAGPRRSFRSSSTATALTQLKIGRAPIRLNTVFSIDPETLI